MPETLNGLIQLMKSIKVKRLYYKILASNDNSKNQIYLGGGFGALNIFPHGKVTTDPSEKAGSKRDRAKAAIKFFWLDDNGSIHSAPNTSLILYPKYPEVRLSGLLSACKKRPSNIINSRDPGRILFLGITATGEIIGYASSRNCALTKELINNNFHEQNGVFTSIPMTTDLEDSKDALLRALEKIYQMHWVPSQKLDKNGNITPYKARNGGGYTLESLLGISPNGYSEPDYLGWEVKQYGVRDFTKFSAKSPVTLLTPEPTGGEYSKLGIDSFIKKYGYPDQSGKIGRYNFGGIYKCNEKLHHLTKTRMTMDGYDFESGKITDMNGGILLISKDEEIAAKWEFTSLLEHWNRKHAKAAYIPSLFQTPPPEYRYAPKITLCEGTNFLLLLSSIANGAVYYDPAIKIENIHIDKPKSKRRSQFRVKHNQLTSLYEKSTIIDLCDSFS